MIKRLLLLLSLLSLFFLTSTGCVWKSDHLKEVGALRKQILGLEKDKQNLQNKLDERTRQLSKMTAEKNRLAKLRARLEKQLTQLSQARAECLSNLKALASTKGKLGKKLQQALDQKRKLEDILRKRKETLDRLRKSFQAMINAGKLKVKMVNGLLVLQLAEKILFSSGRSTLKREGKEAITQVAQILQGMKRRWQVAGHTDNVGNAKFNWQLSTRRALSVLFEMLKAGMPPQYISAAGFGQYQPTAPNDTKENKALNRRTEIMLLPDLSELQLAQNPSPFPYLCHASR